MMILSACSMITTRPVFTHEDRLAFFPTRNLPTTGTLTIRWEDHMIPFVEAEKDSDVPFALGLIHAHLRLGQLEWMRRISQGRISEMAGPFTINFDHSIRILNFGKAAAETFAAMPPETRQWTERFLEGINLYIKRNPDLIPVDLKALGISKIEPWTALELITVWKLASTDVNWMIYFSFLQAVAQSDDPKSIEAAWEKLLAVGAQSVPSFSAAEDPLGQLLFSYTKSGSNSIVVGKSKSVSGHGLIASDPHLGLSIPNFWLIAGFKSPSYRAVGLMIPSLPVIALGRNPTLAWGGTNMWGLSSHLFALTDQEIAAAKSHEDVIQVRGWFNKTVTIRTTPWGPVISDSPFFKNKVKPTALRWVGHEVSDELSAFLKVNRAKTVLEFRSAFDSYAVSAQNFLAADVDGNIGHCLAVRHPLRPNPADHSLLQKTTNNWIGFKKPTELPFVYNPASGYIASANNKPVDSEPDLGWFYQSSDRIRRWKALADGVPKIDLPLLKKWQLDTFSESSLKIVHSMVEKINSFYPTNGSGSPLNAYAVWKRFKTWDGNYEATSDGPVAFETMMSVTLPALLQRRYPNPEALELLSKSPSWKVILLEELDGISAPDLEKILLKHVAGAEQLFSQYPTWEDLHRIEANHLLANVPLLGSRYRFLEFGTGGGSDTLFKTAAPMTGKKAASYYGTNARHVSDLSDLDENYFVLFGGQDGWLLSDHTLDQIPLWRSGSSIRLPLSDEQVPVIFNRAITLGKN